MRTKSAETLPKMAPGAVCAQWVRCGKPGCRCATGRRHGPYHYRFWRQKGKLKKVYVRPKDLPDVLKQCQAWREGRQTQHTWQDLWQEMTELLREVERQCTQPPRP